MGAQPELYDPEGPMGDLAGFIDTYADDIEGLMDEEYLREIARRLRRYDALVEAIGPVDLLKRHRRPGYYADLVVGRIAAVMEGRTQ